MILYEIIYSERVQNVFKETPSEFVARAFDLTKRSELFTVFLTPIKYFDKNHNMDWSAERSKDLKRAMQLGFAFDLLLPFIKAALFIGLTVGVLIALLLIFVTLFFVVIKCFAIYLLKKLLFKSTKDEYDISTELDARIDIYSSLVSMYSTANSFKIINKLIDVYVSVTLTEMSNAHDPLIVEDINKRLKNNINNVFEKLRDELNEELNKNTKQ